MRDNNQTALISVIVPIYNVERYLHRCVGSILSQTYSNLEIILVDDGSPDGCAEICDNFAKSDRRIKVIHQKNGGVSSARNAGLEVFKGRYVTFIDGDDFISLNMVEVLYETLIENQCDVSSCDYAPQYDAIQNTQKFSFNKSTVLLAEQALENMLYQRTIAAAPMAKLYDRKLFQSLRYPVGVRIGEDLDVTYGALLSSNRVVVNSAKLYNYQQRSDSAMHTPFNPDRLDSIAIVENIVAQTKARYPRILPAAMSRAFMEAVFIIIQMPQNNTFEEERQRCMKIIEKYRSRVVRDSHSRFMYRLYAAVSFFGDKSIVYLYNLKGQFKKIIGHN